MAEILKPKKTNPRGIPEAPFIEKVDNVIKDPDNEFQSVMSQFQQRLQQYKYMELSKQQQLADLNIKIPDIEKNLTVIDQLKESKREAQEYEEEEDIEEEGKSKELTFNYELNDTLYNQATVNLEKLDSVYLWLGAEVMLEYPLDEAIELLNERLTKSYEQKTIIEEDLEFLKENITTMEVNTARLFNWDVERRKKLTSK
ncbi:hypothetical protein KGF56_002940 [Candida oxycetoniae]|uniref:Prefoldin subunit 3 n=1 Tax=Candida oxycetoniae TaxID=497107 RepID=A0AAI9SWB4_9ASCO|nr:uncharacterized protein KGF56_002940 [Candida oxycetoniae]KAI3404301.1 hypothetical protein KGF56_002940 [Candida oxycetoniae]